MTRDPSLFLGPWGNFYVMTGSSAAALIGLMFVVMTLVTGTERARRREGTANFLTPTVVHFAAALLISAIVEAPWRSLLYPRIVLALAGVYGVVT